MDGGLKAVLILAIIFGSIYGGRYLRYRTRTFEMQLRAEKEFSGELRKDLDEIRDRLAALERIVTDKGYQLKEEIERL